MNIMIEDTLSTKWRKSPGTLQENFFNETIV